MKKLWDSTNAVQQNLSDFGLAFDANEAIKCKSTKAALIERAKLSDGNPWKTLEEKKQSKLVNIEVLQYKEVRKIKSNVVVKLYSLCHNNLALASRLIGLKFIQTNN